MPSEIPAWFVAFCCRPSDKKDADAAASVA